MKAKAPTPLMLRRQVAAQATFARFHGRDFEWGRADCARMVAFHLRQLGLRPQLAKAGTYRSALTARRALARTGHASLASAIDAIGLLRIAPAAALIGDILALPGDDAMTGLTVALGNGRVLGWHQDAAAADVLQPTAFEAAWTIL